jgi:hypothetical protein
MQMPRISMVDSHNLFIVERGAPLLIAKVAQEISIAADKLLRTAILSLRRTPLRLNRC